MITDALRVVHWNELSDGVKPLRTRSLSPNLVPLQHYTVLVDAISFLSLLSGAFLEIQLVIETISCARSSLFFFYWKRRMCQVIAAGIDLIFFFFAGGIDFDWRLVFSEFVQPKSLHDKACTTIKTWNVISVKNLCLGVTTVQHAGHMDDHMHACLYSLSFDLFEMFVLIFPIS